MHILPQDAKTLDRKNASSAILLYVYGKGVAWRAKSPLSLQGSCTFLHLNPQSSCAIPSLHLCLHTLPQSFPLLCPHLVHPFVPHHPFEQSAHNLQSPISFSFSILREKKNECFLSRSTLHSSSASSTVTLFLTPSLPPSALASPSAVVGSAELGAGEDTSTPPCPCPCPCLALPDADPDPDLCFLVWVWPLAWVPLFFFFLGSS